MFKISKSTEVAESTKVVPVSNGWIRRCDKRMCQSVSFKMEQVNMKNLKPKPKKKNQPKKQNLPNEIHDL